MKIFGIGIPRERLHELGAPRIIKELALVGWSYPNLLFLQHPKKLLNVNIERIKINCPSLFS